MLKFNTYIPLPILIAVTLISSGPTAFAYDEEFELGDVICDVDKSQRCAVQLLINNKSLPAKSNKLKRQEKKAKKQAKKTNRRLKDLEEILRKLRRLDPVDQEHIERVKGRIEFYEKLRANSRSDLAGFKAARRKLRPCKKVAKSFCRLGEPRVPCAPEGCYASDFQDGLDKYLNNAWTGHAEAAGAVVRVGQILTIIAMPYDSNFGVVWPSNLGQQIGTCGYKDTSCSWRMTAPTSGWETANIGITGSWGTGSEQVAYAVIR